MNIWEPISLQELQTEIQKGVSNMTKEQENAWNKIKVEPNKWKEFENGEMGGGFWVVAMLRNEVIYYNDIEEGFNISPFTEFGVIAEYRTEQDELQWTLNKLKRHHNNS